MGQLVLTIQINRLDHGRISHHRVHSCSAGILQNLHSLLKSAADVTIAGLLAETNRETPRLVL